MGVKGEVSSSSASGLCLQHLRLPPSQRDAQACSRPGRVSIYQSTLLVKGFMGTGRGTVWGLEKADPPLEIKH